MTRYSTGVVCASAVLCGVIAGCGTGQREAEAETAAADFLAALDQGDTAAACALLAPDVAEELAASEGGECESSLGSQRLPGGAVDEVDVWGDRAQVRTDADVLFLVELADGWKVAGAGCVPQGERPYRCEVGG